MKLKWSHVNTDNLPLPVCDKEAHKTCTASSPSILLLSKCLWGTQAHRRWLAQEAEGPGQDRASLISRLLLLNYLCTWLRT